MEIKKLRILCSAMDSQGHVNAILGFAKILEKRGHHIIMTLAPGWRTLIEKHGFEFIPLDLPDDKVKEDVNNNEREVGTKEPNGTNDKVQQAPNQKLIELVNAQLQSMRFSPMESVRREGDDSHIWIPWYTKQFNFDAALSKVMASVKPDFIVLDFLMRIPCLEKSSIPWSQLWSCNPIMLYHGNCPPATTGFPTDSPRELWNEYRSLRKAKNKKIFDHVNSWFISNGLRPHGEDKPLMIAESEWMNIYTYPGFLDYNDIAPKLHKWVRMDTSVREPDDSEPFVLPESLKDKPGKLIYFSLGSMGSVDLELMRRVISVLAKSPHRFIISKGPLHEQIDLPDNMWGDRYVNQIGILPHVDLVITHGGNNTLTESLYFGKPIIVMPLFFDQLDNAQRIKEKGVGVRIDTYHFTDQELLEAIEKLIDDDTLKEKLSSISSDLKSSTTSETVCQLIERTVELGKSPFDEDNPSSN